MSTYIHAHYLEHLPSSTTPHTSLSSRVQLPKPFSHASTFSLTQIEFVNKQSEKPFSFIDKCNPLIFDPGGEKKDKDNKIMPGMRINIIQM